MNRRRISLVALVVLGLSVFQQSARAEVWGLRPSQILPKPPGTSYDFFGIGRTAATL
jgi:hypothetical protein